MKKYYEKITKIRYIHLTIVVLICMIVLGYVYIGQPYLTDKEHRAVNNNQDNKTIINNNNQNNKTIVNNINQNNNNQNNKIKEIGTSRYNGHLDLENKSIKLYNNIWGALGKELNSYILRLYVFYKSNDNFGWEWNRPDPSPGKYVTPVYPEAIMGTIPTGKDYTTNMFPIKYGDIKDWTSDIEFSYIKPPKGKYNLAYDIYWMDKDVKKFNIMIWVAGHHDEKPIGIVSDGINDYIHYHRGPGQGQYWDLHVFELKNQNETNVKIDIKKLIDNAITKDNLNDNWIIPGVELGSEVWNGYGRIEIYKYAVSINGRTN